MKSILFIDTENAVRSILAEAIMADCGRRRFTVASGGTTPAAEIHPDVRAILDLLNLKAETTRPKAWRDLVGEGKPPFDIVILLSDEAEAVAEHGWPAETIVAHWSLPDPTRAEGDSVDRRNALRQTFRELETRLNILVNVPIDRLQKRVAAARIDAIAQKASTAA